MIAEAQRYNKYKQLMRHMPGPLSFPGVVPKMIPITNNGGNSSGNDDNDASNLMSISDRNILGLP